MDRRIVFDISCNSTSILFLLLVPWSFAFLMEILLPTAFFEARLAFFAEKLSLYGRRINTRQKVEFCFCFLLAEGPVGERRFRRKCTVKSKVR